MLNPRFYSKTFYKRFKFILEPLFKRWWNNHWKKSYIFYKAKSGMPAIEVNDLLDEDLYSFEPDDYIERQIALIKKHKDNDLKAYKVFELVKMWMKYKYDSTVWNKIEYWQTPQESNDLKTGDCIAEHEEIHTKEGIKKANEIKVGDEVLSYDFDKKQFVYKRIVNLWNKGIKPIKRVHFRNGQHIDVTEEHHMLMRQHQYKSEYIKTDLKDIDLAQWWTRRVPVAKKIPYLVRDIDWLNDDLCFVFGHFLAEGSVSDSHVETSGYESVEEIIPLLEQYNIPFTEGHNGNGVPAIRFLKSDFKEFLKTSKGKDDTLSFSAHIPEDLFSLPERKLRRILDGYFLGDGHITPKGIKCYSTSSEQLMKDFQLIGLVIGSPLYSWKQNNHQGFGNRPIWRIHENINSYFSKSYGFNQLSEVSISRIEDAGECQTYDWEVEDTHNFFFRNGICTSQCEDQTLLFMKLCEKADIPEFRTKACAGYVNYRGKKTGHCYPIYLREHDNNWVLFDLTFYPNFERTEDRAIHKLDNRYGKIWFTFNRLYGWSQHDMTIDWSGKMKRGTPYGE